MFVVVSTACMIVLGAQPQCRLMLSVLDQVHDLAVCKAVAEKLVADPAEITKKTAFKIVDARCVRGETA
jgi:hypothetical protein